MNSTMKTLYRKKVRAGEFQILADAPKTSNLIFTKQTHSNNIVTFSGDELKSIEADGIIASYSHLSRFQFAVVTADCLPVLLLGKSSFALIHAGWRGLENNILKNKNLLDLGIHTALIGPSIQVDHFEVQKDFYQFFPGSINFFEEKDQKLFFNLQKEASKQLRLNFPGITVIDTCICTFKNLEYRSYRRDKTIKRNWNIFSL